jgi:hypothetical protein
VRCGKVKKMLGAYLDGELTDKKASKIEQHLIECASCSWELKSFRKVDEFGQWVTNANGQHLYPWEDYIANLHGKLKKAKASQNSWIFCIYDRFRYSMPGFIAYWFRKLAPGFAFALFIAAIFLGINYIRNDSNEIPQNISPVKTANSIQQNVSIAKAKPVSSENQNEPESQELIFNFYLKEHKNAAIQQVSHLDQPSQKSVEIKDDDVLYYDTIREERQGEAGLILRAPRRPNVPAQISTPQAKQIADSHSLNLEQAHKSVTFKVAAPQTLYPGYLLESIRKLEGKNCIHLIYTNGINTLSVFEQSMASEEKLHPNDFKEYIMYSKEGTDPANIIGWNSSGVSFTVIGNEDFPKLINITREIQESI